MSFPSLVQANTCKVENDLYSSWVEQKSWVQEFEQPSVENPSYHFITYRDSKGALKTSSLNIGDIQYQTKLDMKFSSPGERKVFIDRCEKDSHRVFLNEGNLPSPEKSGSFKVSLNILPQSFVGNVNGDVLSYSDSYNISLGFKEDSLVKKSSSILNNLDDIREAIYEQANAKIKEQLVNGYTGELHIVFDGVPALACDLLKNRVRLFFRHIGQRNMDQVIKTDVVERKLLTYFYGIIKKDLSKVSSEPKKMMLAGMNWEDFRAKSSNDLVASKDVALTFVELLKMKSQDLNSKIQCATDKTASYSNADEFINFFELKTQSLKELKEAL